ncbi:uncharacterized protein [Anabrus simplex]|uniref:uncharacterized protein n=1 Tax=Anabrus simplex TaxID=316456 RepID=UPI0035A37FFD
MPFKMDMEIKIKEEPICFEETSNTSCDNYKIISEEMRLKEEPKSEMAVPRETQPSSDIKNELSVDEHTVDQLVTCFKEEDKFGNVPLITGGPVGTCNSRCKITKEGSKVMCILSTCNGCNLHMSCVSNPSPIHLNNKWELCYKTSSQQHLLIHTSESPRSGNDSAKKFSKKQFFDNIR